MNIAVYCASTDGASPAFREAAAALGRWIGRQGHTLVYGGGESGLMGILAHEAFAADTRVIGVLPGNVPFICSRPQPWCTETITMPDMNTRKSKMLELADAFIALPGGIGTLDEITEAITLTKIGVFSKPAVMFNAAGFYEPFRAMLQTMRDADYLGPNDMDHVLFSDDIAAIEAFLTK